MTNATSTQQTKHQPVMIDWSDEYELTDEYQLEHGDEDTRREIILREEDGYDGSVITDVVSVLIENKRAGEEPIKDEEFVSFCEPYGLSEANARIVIDEAYSRYDKWLIEQDVSPAC